jgi:hypothetical protein
VNPASAAARALEHDDPGLVGRTADDLRAAAEADVQGRLSRSRAYVRRLQALAVERPDLAIAVGRKLNLEHIVEELLDGQTVEGVPGIGADGQVLAPTARHRLRRQGKILLAVSAVVLLVEAVIADGIPSALLYLWTAVGLALFFLGGYFVMLKE